MCKQFTVKNKMKRKSLKYTLKKKKFERKSMTTVTVVAMTKESKN